MHSVGVFWMGHGKREYDQWKIDHYCSINHQKSSGAMESAGAIDIFCSSVDKYQLFIKSMLGMETILHLVK